MQDHATKRCTFSEALNIFYPSASAAFALAVDGVGGDGRRAEVADECRRAVPR